MGQGEVVVVLVFIKVTNAKYIHVLGQARAHEYYIYVTTVYILWCMVDFLFGIPIPSALSLQCSVHLYTHGNCLIAPICRLLNIDQLLQVIEY